MNVACRVAARRAARRIVVAGLAALSILFLPPSLPAAPAEPDGPDPMLLLADGPSAIFLDLFPQDMNSYQTGGWRDTQSGDGTGGRVLAGSDGASILLDGTVNALAYAVRNAPDARDFQLAIDFAIVNEQMTSEDRLSLLLRFKDPTFPTGCCLGGAGQVHASSGVRLEFNVGRGTVTPYREKNGAQGSALAPPTPFSIGFGQTHRLVISYVGGVLDASMDETPIGSWRTPNMVAGRIGLEVYRLDLSVGDVGLTLF